MQDIETLVPFSLENLYITQKEYAIIGSTKGIPSRFKRIGWDDSTDAVNLIIVHGDHCAVTFIDDRNDPLSQLKPVVQELSLISAREQGWKQSQQDEDAPVPKVTKRVYIGVPRVKSDTCEVAFKLYSDLLSNEFRFEVIRLPDGHRGAVYDLERREASIAHWEDVDKYPHFACRFAYSLGAGLSRKPRDILKSVSYEVLLHKPQHLWQHLEKSDAEILMSFSSDPSRERDRFTQLVRKALTWWIWICTTKQQPMLKYDDPTQEPVLGIRPPPIAEACGNSR